jgi:hydrogenase maturation protein HypF
MSPIFRRSPTVPSRMSAKLRFVARGFVSSLKPSRDLLALGTDTQLGLSWAEKGKIATLLPARQGADPGDFYRQACALLARRKSFSPRALAFDAHPYFECGRQAPLLKETLFPSASLMPVYHHVAHAALRAHTAGLKKNFCAITWDGTGYGADGKIWGGEFIVYDGRRFFRAGHLATQYLPGNEKAILEPWRMAFATLYAIYGERVFSLRLKFLKGRSRPDLCLLVEMMKKGFSSPQTSSVGRLFDAAAVLVGVPTPMALEACAAGSRSTKSYPFEIVEKEGHFVVRPDLIFKNIVEDSAAGVAPGDIALKFHRALADAACAAALRIEKKFGVSVFFCSGGVFRNNLLRRELAKAFAKKKLEVSFAPQDWTTDAGIAPGQIAACLMGELCV